MNRILASKPLHRASQKSAVRLLTGNRKIPDSRTMDSDGAGEKKRIAIVDGHTSSRIGLANHIRSFGRWDIAWECGSAEAAQNLVAKDKPDALIMEILLPGKDGLELIKHLMPLVPELKILVHSLHNEIFYAERCIRAGAVGYLPKSDPLDRLQDIIENVLNGDIYLSPKIKNQALHAATHGNGRTRTNGNSNGHLHQLTDRELEIMILTAQGLTAHHTAEKLKISPRTVQVHRNNIRLKVGLETSTQLHTYAVRFYGNGEDSHMAPMILSAPNGNGNGSRASLDGKAASKRRF